MIATYTPNVEPVEAIQVKQNNLVEIHDWLPKFSTIDVQVRDSTLYLFIETTKSHFCAVEGDWIVKHKNESIVKYKNDTFEKHYTIDNTVLTVIL
jgi:hypothetical protein